MMIIFLTVIVVFCKYNNSSGSYCLKLVIKIPIIFIVSQYDLFSIRLLNNMRYNNK